MTIIPLFLNTYKKAQLMMIAAALISFLTELDNRLWRGEQVGFTQHRFDELFRTRDQNQRYMDMAASLLCSPRNGQTLNDLKKLNGLSVHLTRSDSSPNVSA